MTANRIISHIFQQPDLQHVDQAELERLVAQYPYFAAARLLLAQKKYAADHNLADESLKNAQLYSGTTHHLHQFLQGEQPVYTPPAVEAYVPPVNTVAETSSPVGVAVPAEVTAANANAVAEEPAVEETFTPYATVETGVPIDDVITSFVTHEAAVAPEADNTDFKAQFWKEANGEQPAATPEEPDFKAQFWKEANGEQPVATPEEPDFKAQFWKEANGEQPVATPEEPDFKAQFWKEANGEQPVATPEADIETPAADPDFKSQFWKEYYGDQHTPDAIASEATTTPADYSADIEVEDQSEHYISEYYGAPAEVITEEQAEEALGQIEGGLVDHASSSIAVEDETDAFILTADPEPFAADNSIRSIAGYAPAEQVASLAEAEENAIATISATEAILDNREMTLSEAAQNAAATIAAAEAIQEEQTIFLAEAEDNAAATIASAEAIQEEQTIFLAEAEDNAAATIASAEAIQEEQTIFLAEAEDNAAATIASAEAIQEEQTTFLAEAEDNAAATIASAEAIQEEQTTFLAEAEDNAAATIASAEAIQEEQTTFLAEAENNAAATIASAEAIQEEQTTDDIYNTTLDQPGETIEDTSNAAAELEEATAEQFNTLTDAEEHMVVAEHAAEQPVTLPPAEFYNTTLDQPGETIEDTSNAAAELEEVTAEQFNTLTDAEEQQGIPLAERLVPVFDAPLATKDEEKESTDTTEEQPAEISEEGPIKIFPLEMPADEETVLTFQPLYTEDYFAYKRIKEPAKADIISEKGEAEMKSFTDWLRQMKEGFAGKSQRDWYHQQIHRLYEDEEPEISEAVEKMAIESITFNDDIISETLAEVWVRQHQYQKAISIYQKLSLLNPGKSTYFAQKIKDLQSQTDNN